MFPIISGTILNNLIKSINTYATKKRLGVIVVT
jgi:hypothetical protein